MKKNLFKKNTRGIGSLEILIGATIIVTGILALIIVFNSFFSFALANDANVRAAYLGEEGLEAMFFLRDGSWSTNIASLSTTSAYYLAWNSGASTWQTSTASPAYIDNLFLRKITLANVKRDGTGKIVTSGGTLDSNTRLVTATIQYFQGHATTTQTMATYLTNFYGN